MRWCLRIILSNGRFIHNYYKYILINYYRTKIIYIDSVDSVIALYCPAQKSAHCFGYNGLQSSLKITL